MMASRKRNKWEGRGHAAENTYLQELNKLVRTIKQRLSMALGSNYDTLNNVAAELDRLGDSLDEFATKVANNMLKRVDRTTLGLFESTKEKLSPRLRRELLDRSPISGEYRRLMDTQIDLIKGIPRDVAQQIREKTIQYQGEGLRSDDPALIDFIAERSGVAQSRAKMIARTQVSSATTHLVQARATSIGSEGYIWRTSNDSIVRDSHQKLNGKYQRWDSPPDPDGLRGHAGALPNCRCTPQPVFIDP